MSKSQRSDAALSPIRSRSEGSSSNRTMAVASAGSSAGATTRPSCSVADNLAQSADGRAPPPGDRAPAPRSARWRDPRTRMKARTHRRRRPRVGRRPGNPRKRTVPSSPSREAWWRSFSSSGPEPTNTNCTSGMRSTNDGGGAKHPVQTLVRPSDSRPFRRSASPAGCQVLHGRRSRGPRPARPRRPRRDSGSRSSVDAAPAVDRGYAIDRRTCSETAKT